MSALRTLRLKASRRIKQFLGKELVFPVDSSLRCVELGDFAASWWVCPDKLNEKSVVFSVGVGTDISFDLALIKLKNLTIHAFDPTPRSLAWVAKQPTPPNFHIHPFGLAGADRKAVFFEPENPDYISHSLLPISEQKGQQIEVEVCTLATLMKKVGCDKIDLLKIDVEGAEYETIENIAATKPNVTQLLVEFHHGMYPNLTLDDTRKAVESLLSIGYRLFKISDTGREYHFIK